MLAINDARFTGILYVKLFIDWSDLLPETIEY